MNEEFEQLCDDLGFKSQFEAVVAGQLTLTELLIMVIVEQGKTIEDLRLRADYNE